MGSYLVDLLAASREKFGPDRTVSLLVFRRLLLVFIGQLKGTCNRRIHTPQGVPITLDSWRFPSNNRRICSDLYMSDLPASCKQCGQSDFDFTGIKDAISAKVGAD